MLMIRGLQRTGVLLQFGGALRRFEFHHSSLHSPFGRRVVSSISSNPIEHDPVVTQRISSSSTSTSSVPGRVTNSSSQHIREPRQQHGAPFSSFDKSSATSIASGSSQPHPSHRVRSREILSSHHQIQVGGIPPDVSAGQLLLQMRQLFNHGTHPVVEVHRFASAFLGAWPDMPVAVACHPQVAKEFNSVLSEMHPPRAWSNQLSFNGSRPSHSDPTISTEQYFQHLSVKNLSACAQLMHRMDWLEDHFKSLSQSELDASSVVSLHLRRDGEDGRLQHADAVNYRIIQLGYWKAKLLQAMHGYASLFPSLQLSPSFLASATPQSLPLARPISVADAMSEIALQSVQKMVENRAEANTHLLASAMHVHLQAGRHEGEFSPEYIYLMI
jgi:hypothetical protein